jgi:hypothetical protein
MDVLSALPQLVALIEKAGVVGLLAIFCGVLVMEIRRLRKHMHAIRNDAQIAYNERNTALLMVMKLKTLCEANGIAVDLSDVRQMLERMPMPITSST